MQNILRNKPQLQTFLVWMNCLFFFGMMPTKEYKPFIFIDPAAGRAKLKNAARRFELKKSGCLPV